MSERPKAPVISRRIGRFTGDRRALLALLLAAAGLSGWSWLQDHPQHNPWAPLDLRDPPGWATGTKLAALVDDPAQCRAVLARSDIEFSALEPAGDGPCRRQDRTRLDSYPLAAPRPVTTCPVAAAMHLWLEQSVQPASEEYFGQKVTRIEHFGAYSCRRLYGRDQGPWSEHATGNAVDISGFILADGQRVSVLEDWTTTGADGDGKSAFLKDVRDGACASFSTVLSPDYNAAHRDHFHFDRAPRRIGGVCR